VEEASLSPSSKQISIANMIEDALMKTVTVTQTLTETVTKAIPSPDPTSSWTTTTSVAPIPTVIPDHPTFQAVDTAAKRTLWYGGHQILLG
jgi:hypothetical protein